MKHSNLSMIMLAMIQLLLSTFNVTRRDDHVSIICILYQKTACSSSSKISRMDNIRGRPDRRPLNSLILAIMSKRSDVRPWYRVQCEWPLRKLAIQLYMLSGTFSSATFSMRQECRTVSNALKNRGQWQLRRNLCLADWSLSEEKQLAQQL